MEKNSSCARIVKIRNFYSQNSNNSVFYLFILVYFEWPCRRPSLVGNAVRLMKRFSKVVQWTEFWPPSLMFDTPDINVKYG